jgi:hypothetical protein
MTNLDLRIKYRLTTGLSPTYGREGNGKKYSSVGNYNAHNYRGALTDEYAKWLENFRSERRMAFKRHTGEYATYYFKGKLCYRADYKEWLENTRVEVETVLEKLRK